MVQAIFVTRCHFASAVLNIFTLNILFWYGDHISKCGATARGEIRRRFLLGFCVNRRDFWFFVTCLIRIRKREEVKSEEVLIEVWGSEKNLEEVLERLSVRLFLDWKLNRLLDWSNHTLMIDRSSLELNRKTIKRLQCKLAQVSESS
jgi:hypothetical protein